MPKIITKENLLVILILLTGIIVSFVVGNIHSEGINKRNSQRVTALDKINNEIDYYYKINKIYPSNVGTSTVQNIDGTITLNSIHTSTPYYSNYSICKQTINPQINTDSGENFPVCLNTNFSLSKTAVINIKTNTYSTYYFYIPIPGIVNPKNYVIGACLEGGQIYVRSSSKEAYKQTGKNSIMINGQIIKCT